MKKTKGGINSQVFNITLKVNNPYVFKHTPASISIFNTTGPESLDVLCLNSAASFAGSQYCSCQTWMYEIVMNEDTVQVSKIIIIHHELEHKRKNLPVHVGHAIHLLSNTMDKLPRFWYYSLGSNSSYSQNISLETWNEGQYWKSESYIITYTSKGTHPH